MFTFSINSDPRSVYAEGWNEANRHKWLVSERAGHDVGDWAVNDWYRRHWVPFCRQCRLEHVVGSQRWSEFEDLEFAQFYDSLVRGESMIQQVLGQLALGRENLGVIQWALDNAYDMDRIIEILIRVDINGARLPASSAA